ncbi:ABC transporter permease subunit [Allopusillimonas ginsengisoli]|nr:ABC transporter permease subunit [Allopusillimonas ginsengisoli]
MARFRAFLGGVATVVLAACALLPQVAQAQTVASQCNGGQPIKLADQTWESANFTTHVVSDLLQLAFGCETEIVPGTTAATESALAQNDVQIIAEQWTGRSPIIEKAIEAGDVSVVGDTFAGGAEQGWYVPDYVVHGDPARGIKPMAPDLKSWKDLPRYKELFRDPEVPSKGRFLNCPSGWVCEQTNTRLLTVHGLNDDYNNFRAGTGAALDAAISSAYDRGKPVLFYYWQPAGLMAKYDFYKIEQDPFNQACWDTIVSGKGKLCSSDFLVAHLGVGLSTPFINQNPQLVQFLKNLQFQPALLNQMILEMTETRAGGSAMAEQFLKKHPEVWRKWLPADAAARASSTLGIAPAITPDTAEQGVTPKPAAERQTEADIASDKAGAAVADTAALGQTVDPFANAASTAWSIFPDWSVAGFVNDRLVQAVKRYGGVFRDISERILVTILLPVERALQAVPPWLFLAFVAALAWHATRKPVSTVLYVVCLYLIGAVGLWDKLIQTFALVLVSTVFSIVIGIPVGIIAARSRLLRRVLTPVLDVMQTLPSFVYLIPVLMLFGLGKVPALFATVIYAVPPLIRLTILGLRHVDREVMEAAQAFGVTRWQMLTRVSLPLARPSIMAGINQTTMMALAMVVVASMIGARGLGEDVLAGIQTLDVGRGLQAGVAIVILAIVIDRITQAYGRTHRRRLATQRQERV